MHHHSEIFFQGRSDWRAWLELNHASCSEIWIVYYKKHTGKKSLIYREALEEALCFGWIDGTVKRIDEEKYMQRFTPRRKKSNWSLVNIKLALKLLSEGKMHPSGLYFQKNWEIVPVEPLKNDLDNLRSKEFEQSLAEFPAALINYQKLSVSCKKQYLQWILAAKREETRNKRIAESITLLEKGKKLGMM